MNQMNYTNKINEASGKEFKNMNKYLKPNIKTKHSR